MTAAAKKTAKAGPGPKGGRAIPTLALETLLIQSSGGPVCGVDEAGRGPWAGPVSAAAVILNPDDLPAGIDDSKVLTAEKREALEIEIKARALAWGVGFASVDEIAELNILHATGVAMCRAVEVMAIQPVAALVDGNYRFKLPCDVQTVVGGDGLSLSIAAASILAKTVRDAGMLALHATYPQYGFDRHMGYPTAAHVAALEAHGASPVHRTSFGPVARQLSLL